MIRVQAAHVIFHRAGKQMPFKPLWDVTAGFFFAFCWVYIHIYIYICVCVCTCMYIYIYVLFVCSREKVAGLGSRYFESKRKDRAMTRAGAQGQRSSEVIDLLFSGPFQREGPGFAELKILGKIAEKARGVL